VTRPKVFVVQPIMEVGRAALQELADVEINDSARMIPREALLEGVHDCDYLWMLGDTPIDEEVMEAAPKLKGIATMALFPNVVDVEAASRRGLPVTVVPHVITKTTCDLTCALVLGLFWRLVEADRSVREGRFHQEQSTTFLTRELAGKLVGLGEIGREIVKRLRAFEMDVIYTKRHRLPEERERELGVGWEPDRDELLRTADVVVLMATYNETTHKMIGARELGLMKPSAFFVNTARGRIVDEPALIEALRQGEDRRSRSGRVLAGATGGGAIAEPGAVRPAQRDPHAAHRERHGRGSRGDEPGRGREPAGDDRGRAGSRRGQPRGLRRSASGPAGSARLSRTGV
jgi:glyoxylate reductase